MVVNDTHESCLFSLIYKERQVGHSVSKNFEARLNILVISGAEIESRKIFTHTAEIQLLRFRKIFNN